VRGRLEMEVADLATLRFANSREAARDASILSCRSKGGYLQPRIPIVFVCYVIAPRTQAMVRI
jgi:hypothetical protein